MTTTRRLLIVALVAGVPPLAGLAAPPEKTVPDPMKRFGWFADLAGACWRTTLPDGITVDTQCYEPRYDRFVFGRITIDAQRPAPSAGASPAPPHRPGFEGESVFAWDEEKGRITFTFWGSNGNFGHGEAHVDGERIHFPGFNRRDPAAPESRSTWKRLDADSYRVAQEEKAGAAWTEKWAVVYRRVRP